MALILTRKSDVGWARSLCPPSAQNNTWAHKTCPPYLAVRIGVALCAITFIFTTTAHAADPIPIVARPFAELAIYPEIKAPATVVSDNDSRISAEISARIIDIPVRVGEIVQAGELLIRLEQQDFELAVDRAKAALHAIDAHIELAQYELKRAQSLSKKQAVSEQLLKQRETELKTLLAEQDGQQAALKQARRQLEKTLIRSPFTAIIAERLGQVGELSNPGTPLLRIVDAEHLEVAAKLQAEQAAELRQQTSLTFVSARQRYKLKLRTITPVIDSRARTREARLLFDLDPKKDPLPLPGMAGELIWRHSQPSLPADMITKRGKHLGVFTLRGNQARFVVLPNAREGRLTTTHSIQLKPDTLIITKGRYQLHDGDMVATPTVITH